MNDDTGIQLPCGYIFELIGDGDGPGEPWLPLDGRRVSVNDYPELAELAKRQRTCHGHTEGATTIDGAGWVILPDASPRRIYIKARNDG